MFIAGAAAAGSLTERVRGSNLARLPRFYLIGVYQQPVSLHQQWKDLGINALFMVPQGTASQEWRASARRLGLAQIRYPEGVVFNEKPTFSTRDNYILKDPLTFEADMTSGEMLAAAFFDEPSNVVDGSGLVGRGHGAFDPEMMSDILSKWHGRGVPIWLNQVGNHIRNPYLSEYMSKYAHSKYVDWFSSDSYPVSEHRNWPIVHNGTLSTEQGHDIDQVRHWSDGRQQMVFIETGPIHSHGNQIDADQFLAQALSAIIHGSVGHIYFTIKLSPDFSFDSSPPFIKDAMFRLHRYIKNIHDNLLFDRNIGGRRPYRLRPSAPNANGYEGEQLPFPFEGAEIRANDGRIFRMILNLQSSPQVLRDPEWAIADLILPRYGFAHGYKGDPLSIGI
ncbi:hypothetical protein SAMN02799631_06331 [Methylobacterium sp. 174MFSha1.1]|nr:hypothetical protein SAMN02799631_06331 [Methylobacterium sp. 174MFSha1.1]